MSTTKIVPIKHESNGVSSGDYNSAELIRQAQQSDTADRQLTVLQALKKYKKGTFWAMFLSTALIMEGFDLVIV